MTTEPESPAPEGSSLREAIYARLEADELQCVTVAPMAELLEQIRERVDRKTWKLVLELERRAGLELTAGVEIGLELGYERGRTAALVEDQRGSGTATGALRRKLADLLADTSSEYPDVMLALLAALQATLAMARGEQPEGWPAPRPSGRELATGT